MATMSWCTTSVLASWSRRLHCRLPPLGRSRGCGAIGCHVAFLCRSAVSLPRCRRTRRTRRGSRVGRYCSPSGTSPKTLGRRMSAPLSMSLAGAFLRPSAAQWWAAVMPFLPLSLTISQVCCRLLSKCSEPEGRPSSTQILLRGTRVSPLPLIRRLYPAGWRDAFVRPRETADPWVCHRRLGLFAPLPSRCGQTCCPRA